MQNIKVYNDNEKVFEGLLLEWLEINDNDSYLVALTSNMQKGNEISFNDHSGNWLVKFI